MSWLRGGFAGRYCSAGNLSCICRKVGSLQDSRRVLIENCSEGLLVVQSSNVENAEHRMKSALSSNPTRRIRAGSNARRILQRTSHFRNGCCLRLEVLDREVSRVQSQL